MPISIDRDELRAVMAGGGQLVEVLPEAEYSQEHLAGAVNSPLRHLTSETIAYLDPRRPVVVYCWDAL